MKFTKVALTVLLTVSLISSCSSEPSPQEKRNNYDKCVLDYIADHMSGSIPAMDAVKAKAPFECRHLLG